MHLRTCNKILAPKRLDVFVLTTDCHRLNKLRRMDRKYVKDLTAINSILALYLACWYCTTLIMPLKSGEIMIYQGELVYHYYRRKQS